MAGRKAAARFTVKRMAIVAFPASMSAAISEMQK